MILDVLIRDAVVYDGITEPPRSAAVGIRGGRIVLVGEPPVGHAAARAVWGRGSPPAVGLSVQYRIQHPPTEMGRADRGAQGWALGCGTRTS